MGQPDKLNIHMVPHTHDDVGWTQTVDGYYYTRERVIKSHFHNLKTFLNKSKEPKNPNLTSALSLFYRIYFNFERVHICMIENSRSWFYSIIYLGVQYILDSIIEALVENPDRRYIYVEIAYFWRWWNEQSEDIHNTVKQLVNDG